MINPGDSFTGWSVLIHFNSQT